MLCPEELYNRLHAHLQASTTSAPDHDSLLTRLAGEVVKQSMSEIQNPRRQRDEFNPIKWWQISRCTADKSWRKLRKITSDGEWLPLRNARRWDAINPSERYGQGIHQQWKVALTNKGPSGFPRGIQEVCSPKTQVPVSNVIGKEQHCGPKFLTQWP